MDQQFWEFVANTNKENFLHSMNRVCTNEDYDPYSDDLSQLEILMDEGKLEEAVAANNINLLLSPRAHMVKHIAYTQLGKKQEADAELLLAHKILECMAQTGDGTAENPYQVIRITDERDMLLYLEEESASQGLVVQGDKKMDLIRTLSGKELYFDISACFTRMQALMSQGRYNMQKLLEQAQEQPPKRKWWQFWKS
jgi:hypothetical protein